jgi:formate hydrogenlyase subunit 3/multisubunit Na+/H+ antiporter MnhD subunit
MLLGIGTGTPVGVIGGLFYMLNNTIYKSCLFLCAGSVGCQTGWTRFSDLGGLAKDAADFCNLLARCVSDSGCTAPEWFRI